MGSQRVRHDWVTNTFTGMSPALVLGSRKPSLPRGHCPRDRLHLTHRSLYLLPGLPTSLWKNASSHPRSNIAQTHGLSSQFLIQFSWALQRYACCRISPFLCLWGTPTVLHQGLQPFLIFLSQVKVLVTQSCPTLCDPMDCSPPGSSAHGIFQARTLK